MIDPRVRSLDQEHRIGIWLWLSFTILSGFVLAPGRLHAQSQKAAQADQQFPPLIRSTQGVDLFRAYCASCHGTNGKGHGPAAVALKTAPADLTTLSKNNSGQFPAARVRKVIMGDDVLASHGSREMPVWGPIFHQVEADVDRGNVRLENLVRYLESIQSASRE